MRGAMILVAVAFLAVIEAFAVEEHRPHHHIVKHQAELKTRGADLNKKAVGHDHKHKDKKEKKSVVHYEVANKGQSDEVKHKVTDSESGAKKSNSLSKGEHQTFKKSAARGSHGANHRMANMAKKANISKGFRELHHKNEKKQHDSFYTNQHNGGNYKIYGQKKRSFVHHADKDENGKYVAGKKSGKYAKKTKASSYSKPHNYYNKKFVDRV